MGFRKHHRKVGYPTVLSKRLNPKVTETNGLSYEDFMEDQGKLATLGQFVEKLPQYMFIKYNGRTVPRYSREVINHKPGGGSNRSKDGLWFDGHPIDFFVVEEGRTIETTIDIAHENPGLSRTREILKASLNNPPQMKDAYGKDLGETSMFLQGASSYNGLQVVVTARLKQEFEPTNARDIFDSYWYSIGRPILIGVQGGRKST